MTQAFELDVRDAERTGFSGLKLDGRGIGNVKGSVIDGQFICPDAGYLVLVSYGEMFSALETAYYVDRHHRIVDRLTMGSAMEQGLISDLAIDGQDAVTFAFPMNERRRLRVRREAGWFGLRVRYLHLD